MPRPRSLAALVVAALLAACSTATMGPEPILVPEPMSEPAGARPMEAARVADAAPVPGRPTSRTAARGVITAGDIDDVLNLSQFRRYVARTAPKLGLPRMDLGAPLLVYLAGPDGDPAPGARFTLRLPGAAEPFHDGYAGADGRIAAFPAVLGAGTPRRVELRVFGANGQEMARKTVPTGSWQTVTLPEASDWQPDFLDLLLVVDTTGSMADEIAFLQKELVGLVRQSARTAPGISIRYGLVAYRDVGDDYVVANYGFTDRAGTMASWLRGLSADGGGDYPEAAAAAMRAGVDLNWRRGRGERLLIHVADAPPHDGDSRAYLDAARAAADQGVQIFTLGASGVAAESEFLMRQASVATDGRYLFLTDDSGVGLAHAEPTIPCYRVTRLSRLLASILATELSGHRQEPDGTLREVGSYDRGVCAS